MITHRLNKAELQIRCSQLNPHVTLFLISNNTADKRIDI